MIKLFEAFNFMDSLNIKEDGSFDEFEFIPYDLYIKNGSDSSILRELFKIIKGK